MVASESTATVTRAPLRGQGGQAPPVDDLVGEQQVLAQAGPGHALPLGHRGAREADVAWARRRAASAVHLWAFT